MSVTIDLEPEEMAEIRERTQAATDEEAIHLAAREYLRLLRLRELKEAPGRFDFRDPGDTWEALEHTASCDPEPAP